MNALMTKALADLDVDPQRSVADALDGLAQSPDVLTPDIRARALPGGRHVPGLLGDPPPAGRRP